MLRMSVNILPLFIIIIIIIIYRAPLWLSLSWQAPSLPLPYEVPLWWGRSWGDQRWPPWLSLSWEIPRKWLPIFGKRTRDGPWLSWVRGPESLPAWVWLPPLPTWVWLPWIRCSWRLPIGIRLPGIWAPWFWAPWLWTPRIWARNGRSWLLWQERKRFVLLVETTHD